MDLSKFVAIDFETANQNYGSACQISLVQFESGVPVRSLTEYIAPHPKFEKLAPMNYRLHGISQSEYMGKKPISELLPVIQDFIGDAWVVAHNAVFDIQVLSQSLAAWNIESPIRQAVCSKNLSKQGLPELGRWNLPTVAERLQVPLEKHHAAYDDALACGLITNKLMWSLGLLDYDVLFDRFGYSLGSTSRPSFAGNSKLDAQRREVEIQQEELEAFFERGPHSYSICEQPLLGMTVGVLRSVFKTNDATIQHWIEVLGGEAVKVDENEWPDYLLVGDDARAETSKKLEDILLLKTATKKEISRHSPGEFFDLVMSAISPQ